MGGFFVTLLATGDAPATASEFPVPAPMDSVRRILMEPAGFRSGDFDLLINYPSTLPSMLSTVELLLRDPLGADAQVATLRVALSGATASGMVDSGPLWTWLDIPAPDAPEERDPATLLRSVEENLEAWLAPLSREDVGFLLREAPPLFRHRAEDTALGPVARELERLRGEAVTDEVMRLAGSLRMEALARAARDLDAVLDILVVMLREEGSPAVVRELRRLRRAGFPVTIGTEGDDVHRLDRGIVFDPGGDDRYVFPDTARPGTWLLVLDAGGNDTYLARDTMGAAAGFLSLQVLANLEGNDRYLGGDFAYGSALMGYSRLLDVAGDDLYEAGQASLGFAFHGLAILEDRDGHDLYSTTYLSQGVASTRGLALLLDHAGNDQYLSRPVFVDDLRYADRFLSLSQGFSIGFAPRHAGGIGVLWDRDGHDLYSADIYAQGAGYWFGWGLLMDDAGNDKYLAHQYAQGAGVHFAVGMLWDGAGDDVRVSKGVSQGCGHDGAFGLLVDASGDDRNIAVDMSAGAGSANGLGVFLDFAGNDTYAMGNPAMTLGHADMRRDRGSLGFFLDRGGRDAWPAGFSPDSVRRVYDGERRGHGYGLATE